MISFEVWQKCYKAGSHRITFFLWMGNLFKGQPFLSLDSFDWTRMLGSELHLAGMKDCCNLAN